VKGLSTKGSLFGKIAQRDYLIYAPYHTFSYVTRFLREAALDPKVRTIKITVYRLAKNSQIASALINAAKNGKHVTVQIELQARFDEQNNIEYANYLQAEGVNRIFAVPDLKAPTKIGVVAREEGHALKRYGIIRTGPFNDATAKAYTASTLFPAHDGILTDVITVFGFFETNYKTNTYRRLTVSPPYTTTTS